jgi:hypothetical protein
MYLKPITLYVILQASYVGVRHFYEERKLLSTFCFKIRITIAASM